ncbi:MAG: AMP-binding protein, partial [Limnohabitans sp.]
MKPHHAHWPLRVPHQFTPSQTTLWHNLSISAQRFSRKTALDFLGRQTTYHELAQQAERLAAWLAQKGVQKGDRVLLYMQNCPQWVVAHFGILRANAVVVPVNPMNRAKEIEHYIQDAQAKVAITTADLAAYLAQASDALPPAIALDHVLVTEYTDAFDPTAQASEQWPLAWQDW